MQYMNEFLTIALVHLVAVASPGPDFAVVLLTVVAPPCLLAWELV